MLPLTFVFLIKTFGFSTTSKYGAGNETDFMVQFDKKITFKDKIIKLKNAETIDIYKKDNLNIAKVKTYEVSIDEA